MKLYKLSQTQRRGYDTYDSCIVAAESEISAAMITPNGEFEDTSYSSWCSSVEHVTVEYIGEAKEGTTEGVILASFNAG